MGLILARFFHNANPKTGLRTYLFLLKKIASTLSASDDLENALQMVVAEATLELGLDSATIMVIDASGRWAVVRAHHTRCSTLPQYGDIQLPIERYPALAEVIRTATTKELDFPAACSWQAAQTNDDRVDDRLRSVIVPLVSEGRVMGVFLCQSAHPEIHFPEQETLVLEVAADLIASALLRARSQRKEATFSMLAHDLRSPILMVAQLLGLSVEGVYGSLTAEQQQILGGLRDHCDLLLGLVNDVLDVSSYETRTLVLGKTVVDLSKIIPQSVSLLRFIADDKRVRVETSCDAEIPHLIADEKRLMRVLINLLDNAIRFSPPGKTVMLDCRRLADQVCITVTDAGPGVPRKHQQKIFDKFCRVETRRTQGTAGAGLGLAFCWETIHAHGGRIWVESPVGGRDSGCRFCFTLPYRQPPG